jgi:serine/threonine protein kinase
MGATAAVHPNDPTLQAYGLGKLDDASAESVNKHLSSCSDCERRVAEMSSDSFLGRLRGAQGGPAMSATDRSQFGGSLIGNGPAVAASPPAAETLPPGLADHPDYEIKRELGRGGMGVVYLAHNRLMGRDEVLKVMGRHIMERPGVLDRFLREIRAVAKLRHPNIVTAYHATRIGESIVFAMEYVEGLDLSRMVKAKGPLPVAHACFFAHQAALGLEHAHEEGLVHRDMKPGNLMLSRKKDKATVKILDFGLARVTREEKVDLRLTSEGQALGTPDYIAPEQIVDATTADIRADIYSLGGTLYHLLTGRPPFQASSLYDMFQAHIFRDADPLNLVRPEVPAELAAVVAKMMAKDPGRRFQTPKEVAEVLMPFFKKDGVGGRRSIGDASQVGQHWKSGDLGGREPISAQPAASTAPVRPLNKPVETARPEKTWESLIEGRKEENSIGAAPTVEPSWRPRWMWPSVAVGGRRCVDPRALRCMVGRCNQVYDARRRHCAGERPERRGGIR